MVYLIMMIPPAQHVTTRHPASEYQQRRGPCPWWAGETTFIFLHHGYISPTSAKIQYLLHSLLYHPRSPDRSPSISLDLRQCHGKFNFYRLRADHERIHTPTLTHSLYESSQSPRTQPSNKLHHCAYCLCSWINPSLTVGSTRLDMSDMDPTLRAFWPYNRPQPSHHAAGKPASNLIRSLC
jgi:hypothetical protein